MENAYRNYFRVEGTKLVEITIGKEDRQWLIRNTEAHYPRQHSHVLFKVSRANVVHRIRNAKRSRFDHGQSNLGLLSPFLDEMSVAGHFGK